MHTSDKHLKKAHSELVDGRDIYEVANQLEGYVDMNTPDDLTRFLLKEGKAAAALADEIVKLRLSCFDKSPLRKKLDMRIHAQRMNLKMLWSMYSGRTQSWRTYTRDLVTRMSELLDDLGVPRETDDGGILTLYGRMTKCRDLLKVKKTVL